MTEASEVKLCLPRKARAGCELRYPQTIWFAPAPLNASLPSRSFHIYACLIELYTPGFLSRHHIGLHYAWCLEGPRMKPDNALVCMPPRGPAPHWL